MCLNQFIEEYIYTASKTISKQDAILALYKDLVKVGSLLGGMLSLSERHAIRAEVAKAKVVFNLNLRGKEVLDLNYRFDHCYSAILFGDYMPDHHKHLGTVCFDIQHVKK